MRFRSQAHRVGSGPLLLLVCWLITGVTGGAATPVKLAGAARFDLNATADTGGIDDGEIVSGDGWVDRQSWLAEAEWPRTYMVHVPVLRFAWKGFEFRFVPRRTGRVEINLRGPWEEVVAGQGAIYRQDVLWDGLRAEGATVVNGGFESVSGARIVGWEGGTSQAASVLVPAVEGGRVARTWHDGTMRQTFTVTGGVPVVLRFSARAAVPDGYPDMKPVADRNSPAHRAALRFARGVNFGNNLELPPGSPARQAYTRADFALARAEGFDHVRLPVGWQHYAGPAPAFTIDPGIFAEVDRLVGDALAEGLSILVDVHHFEEFVEDPAAHTDQLYAMWGQIAAHYAGAPPAVAFEVLNEPTKEATTEVMNPIFAEAIRRIRVTNPDRTLFIGTGGFNNVGELNRLLLPDDDANLIATVHTYDPFLFTHQGQPWAGDDAAATSGLVFPGPPTVPLVPAPGISEWATNWIAAYNTEPRERNPCGPAAFRASFQFIRQWSEYFGRPVHVGEFGAFESIDPVSRANYYRAKRQALEEAGIGWAIWDWKGGFHYQKEGRPEPPELRGALFPPPQVRAVSGGGLECAGGIGRTLVIERAAALGSLGTWQPVSTQVLAAPKLLFADPAAPGRSAGFYRARWER